MWWNGQPVCQYFDNSQCTGSWYWFSFISIGLISRWKMSYFQLNIRYYVFSSISIRTLNSVSANTKYFLGQAYLISTNLMRCDLGVGDSKSFLVKIITNSLWSVSIVIALALTKFEFDKHNPIAWGLNSLTSCFWRISVSSLEELSQSIWEDSLISLVVSFSIWTGEITRIFWKMANFLMYFPNPMDIWTE